MTCPACNAPIHVEQRFVMESTDGPIEHVKGLCARGHPVCCAVALLADEPKAS